MFATPAVRIAMPLEQAMLEGLPEPAQRFLRRALPMGTPLSNSVIVEMAGELKLNGWASFTATQQIIEPKGLVWRPRIGPRIFPVLGADEYSEHYGGRTKFALLGLIPVANDSGPHVSRSAAGRYAAELVAWLPQATVGLQWHPSGDDHATVEVPTHDGPVRVEIAVDSNGRLTEMCLQRWRQGDPWHLSNFGGAFDSEFVTEQGVRIAGSGVVGWDWQTHDWEDGEFFRFTLTAASHEHAEEFSVHAPRIGVRARFRSSDQNQSKI